MCLLTTALDSGEIFPSLQKIVLDSDTPGNTELLDLPEKKSTTDTFYYLFQTDTLSLLKELPSQFSERVCVGLV